MSEGERIAELYDSVYLGDKSGEAWYGAALKPLLKDVGAEQASQQTSAGAHSIFQLVSHISYWEEIVLRRFNGEVVNVPLNTADDWPPNRKLSDGDWKSVLARLEKSHTALKLAMEKCSDDKLQKLVPGKDHTNYILLHGIIHHSVYHTGQIALVKKTLAK